MTKVKRTQTNKDYTSKQKWGCTLYPIHHKVEVQQISKRQVSVSTLLFKLIKISLLASDYVINIVV